MKESSEDTLLKGQIVKKAFINKANREIKGVSDLFFETGKKNYFIKLSGGNVSRKDLEKFLNKQVQLKVMLLNGTWDTSPEHPEVQSRIGEYIIVLEIIK
ncbi:MAG: hypothetical protein ACJ75J_12350 [Cytophagaceae bacterium]